MGNDELQVYRGKDFVINDKIQIHQPTLGEIADWGEQKYFSFVQGFTATPTDLKYILSLSGVDWNTISDYELFLTRYKTFGKDLSAILFGHLNLAGFQIAVQKENDSVVLVDPASQAVIDRSIYEIITEYLRKTHRLEKNVERAMNETTRQVLLDEAREQYEASQDSRFHSVLLPLISALTNMEGFKYSWSTVWDMKINAFMDSVTSILHIKNADHLLTSGYSGFGIDLKKVSPKELNYFITK